MTIKDKWKNEVVSNVKKVKGLRELESSGGGCQEKSRARAKLVLAAQEEENLHRVHPPPHPCAVVFIVASPFRHLLLTSTHLVLIHNG